MLPLLFDPFEEFAAVDIQAGIDALDQLFSRPLVPGDVNADGQANGDDIDQICGA